MSNFTVTSIKEVAVQYYKEMLYKRSRQSRLFLKDDYKELVKTSMLLLLGEIPPKFSWKTPGAAHKARLCSFGI